MELNRAMATVTVESGRTQGQDRMVVLRSEMKTVSVV